ncbi:YcaO-like family protein [Sulfitobacter aestuariivivens]|uniref:YcaO-like family protein n=1 Tax=Sulfitobacter aestuariivivens TaxID=2766981 RepID=UPI00360BBD4F
MNYAELTRCFDLLSVTPAEGPGRFAFCVPNANAYARWPDYPVPARPESGRAASGRGLTAEQCRASALGEAVELASACVWGDEPLVTASPDALGASAVSPVTLNGFSDGQIATRDVWNAGPYGALDWRSRAVDTAAPIDWMVAITCDGTRCHVPADYVLVGRREKGDAGAIAIATTSGCASAATLEEAKRAALLELIERDAVGRWWYGRVPRPEVPVAEFAVPGDVSAYLSGRARQTLLLDLTTHIGVPVIAALSHAADGRDLGLGFGCHPNPSDAARSAITELFQTEIGLQQRAGQGDPLHRIWVETATVSKVPLAQVRAATPTAIPGDLSELTLRLARQGLTTAFVDLTRVAFDVPVVRAIVPGLWTDKPRFAGLRSAGIPEPDKFLPLLV